MWYVVLWFLRVVQYESSFPSPMYVWQVTTPDPLHTKQSARAKRGVSGWRASALETTSASKTTVTPRAEGDLRSEREKVGRARRLAGSAFRVARKGGACARMRH